MKRKPSKAHEDILAIINNNNGVTVSDLALMTGYARTGIASRVAELRKMGYDIKTKTKEVQAYFLVDKSENNRIDYSYAAEQIIHYVVSHNLFGQTIDFQTLSRQLNLSIKEIIGGIVILFKKYNILQMSPMKVVIRR